MHLKYFADTALSSQIVKITDQGERKMMKSSWDISSLDSALWLADLALMSQIGQSQRWIERADISATDTLPLHVISFLQCIFAPLFLFLEVRPLIY